MIRWLAAFAVVAVVGCRESPQEPLRYAAPDVPGETRVYECDDLVFTANVYHDRVAVQLPERELLLQEFVGATGPRYSDGSTMLWFEGDRVTLEHDRRTYVCQRADAQTSEEPVARHR